jgi:hypothetical protein
MNAHGAAAPSAFSFRNLFRRILDDTGLKASTVARELQRERSLMYKWLAGSSVPPSSYVPLLVQVVMKHSSQAKRLILSNSLRAIVRDAGLPVELRDALLRAGSIEGMLSECLDLSLTPNLAGVVPQTARRIGIGNWSVLFGALFAAVCGGILWNAMNRILGWPYFMGSTREALRGWHALVWGLVTMAPVPAPLLLMGPGTARARRVLPAVLFTLVGGASAVLFYSSDIRAAIENLGFGYALQETIVVVIFALALSVPPHLAALVALQRRPRLARGIVTLLVPTAAALLGFLVTLVIDRPVFEVVQLRGFVVGFSLRIAQFFSLYAVMVPWG